MKRTIGRCLICGAVEVSAMHRKYCGQHYLGDDVSAIFPAGMSQQAAIDRLIEREADCYDAYVRFAWAAFGSNVKTPTPVERMIARVAARHVIMSLLDALDESEPSLITSYVRWLVTTKAKTIASD